MATQRTDLDDSSRNWPQFNQDVMNLLLHTPRRRQKLENVTKYMSVGCRAYLDRPRLRTGIDGISSGDIAI
jgi:hypothetical protein